MQDRKRHITDILVVVGLCNSIGAARRLITKGGVKHNGKMLELTDVFGKRTEFKPGDILEVVGHNPITLTKFQTE